MFNTSAYNASSNDAGITDLIQIPTVQNLFLMCYTVIFVVGVSGNVLTCYVVCRNRTMQTVTNFFITNLALSDILLCLICIPFTPLYTFTGIWHFGEVMCHFFATAQGLCVYTSIVTLTSIAVDRFFVIIYPFRQRMRNSTCFAIVLGSWVFSFVMTIPYAINIKYVADNKTCEEEWEGDGRKIFGLITFVIQFVLPFTIIAFCYIKVSMKLNEQARAKPGQKNCKREEMDRERKKRTNRMLISMVSIFGLSWLPLNCANMLSDFGNEISNHVFYFFSCHVIAMSSTCYNPFLYAWLNENFRKEFKQVLPGFYWSRSLSSSDQGGGWRSDKTCNGNETEATILQSTSMIRRCSSVRAHRAEATEQKNIYVEDGALLSYNFEQEAVLCQLKIDDKRGHEENRTEQNMVVDSTVIGSELGQLV